MSLQQILTRIQYQVLKTFKLKLLEKNWWNFQWRCGSRKEIQKYLHCIRAIFEEEEECKVSFRLVLSSPSAYNCQYSEIYCSKACSVISCRHFETVSRPKKVDRFKLLNCVSARLERSKRSSDFHIIAPIAGKFFETIGAIGTIIWKPGLCEPGRGTWRHRKTICTDIRTLKWRTIVAHYTSKFSNHNIYFL